MSLRDVAFIAGLCLIAVGVAAIYWPAGLIVAGALSARVAWTYERGAATERKGRA